MKHLKTISVIFILTICSTIIYGQKDYLYKKTIQKIDSIAQSQQIELGVALFNEITSSFDKTATRQNSLSEKDKFSFDGHFLVIKNRYFNMEKLLYFIVVENKNKYIEFYFQAY